MARRGGKKHNRNVSSSRRGSIRPTRSKSLHRLPDRVFINPYKSDYVIHPDLAAPSPRRQHLLTMKFSSRVPSSPSVSNRNLQKLINVMYSDSNYQRAIICAKRAMRREVLMAAGKGGSKVRSPKYKSESSIRC